MYATQYINVSFLGICAIWVFKEKECMAILCWAHGSSLDYLSHPLHISADTWVRCHYLCYSWGSERLGAWPWPLSKLRAGQKLPVQIEGSCYLTSSVRPNCYLGNCLCLSFLSCKYMVISFKRHLLLEQRFCYFRNQHPECFWHKNALYI